MHLYLADYLTRTGISANDFFRSAYFWRFKTYPNIGNDVTNYRVHGIIPVYVADYVAHIQASH